MKRLLLFLLSLIALSSCKSNVTETIKPQYDGVYSGNYEQSIIGTGTGDVIVKQDKNQTISLSFTGTNPHLELSAGVNNNGSFTIKPTLIQGNNIPLTFSGNGQFTDNNLTVNLYSDYDNNGKTSRQVIVFTGKRK